MDRCGDLHRWWLILCSIIPEFSASLRCSRTGSTIRGENGIYVYFRMLAEERRRKAGAAPG
jgi:hypothetical protein